MLEELEYEDFDEDTSEEEDEDFDEDDSEEEEPVIINKDWRVAGYEDTEKLRPLGRPRKVQIIINKLEKVYAEFFIRDLTIDQQLTIEEAFISLEPGKKGQKKKEKVKLNLKEYYRLCYIKTVKKTNPPHLKKWKEIKRFRANTGVWRQIKDFLPNPYKADTEIADQDEAKN